MKTLHDILNHCERTRFATDAGTQMHKRLQRVTIEADKISGDPDVVACISAKSELLPFFCASAKTEVPIAGTIKGRFISRRIDRLVVNASDKTVSVLDYKTDTDKTINRDKYISQVREYIALLHAVYPDYAIKGYILWTHDFSLEKI